MRSKNIDRETPARWLGVRPLAANRKAMADCLMLIPESTIARVLDIRYGTGGWAKQTLERFPDAKVRGYERDAETSREAWRSPSVRLLTVEWRPRLAVEGIDLLLADYSACTVISRAQLDEAVATISPTYLIFSDGACAKLSMNYKRYGLKRPDLADYWRAWRIAGYKLVGWAKRHRTVSVSLWKKKTPVVAGVAAERGAVVTG